MAEQRQQRHRGKAALDQLYRRTCQRDKQPLVFLDFDDVLCISKPYDGFDVFQPDSGRPSDLWARLWSQPAVQTLLTVLDEFRPQVVLTTSWLRLMPRDGFVSLFQRTGLGAVADSLHAAWDAPQDGDVSRLGAIECWLHARYDGQPMLVLDDELSGTGLLGSKLQKAGCVVLCQAKVGLHAGHLPAIRSALAPGPLTTAQHRAIRAAEPMEMSRVVDSLLHEPQSDEDGFTPAELQVIQERLARRHEAVEVDPETMEPIRRANSTTLEAITEAKAGRTSRASLDEL